MSLSKGDPPPDKAVVKNENAPMGFRIIDANAIKGEDVLDFFYSPTECVSIDRNGKIIIIDINQ